MDLDIANKLNDPGHRARIIEEHWAAQAALAEELEKPVQALPEVQEPVDLIFLQMRLYLHRRIMIGM